MKSKALFLLVLPLSILNGCILSDPLEYGEACPGLDKAGSLNYIENRQTCSAEHALSCTFDDQLDEDGHKISFNFATYFNKRHCPPQYPKCKMDIVTDAENQDYTFYHCEKDTRTQIECIGNQIKCPVNTGNDGAADEFECIDPESNNTCGASSCDAKTNYGGKNCFLYNAFSSCQPAGKDNNGKDKFQCQCAGGALQCDGNCIDPKSKITCGAHDCSLENYGGEDCTEYDDKRVCAQDAKTKQYSCVCREGDILCNGKCITPETSVEHCGAKGLCNEPDKSSQNFEGADCGSGGYCDNGVCKCEDGEGILCGDKCVIPESSDDHCGAKGLCNDPDSTSDNYRGTDCGLGGFCHDGQCGCFEGIWCIAEDGKGQCMLATGHETCNAHVIDEAGHCEYTECKINELCHPASESTYFCEATSCDATVENLCFVKDRNECVSKLDTHHCNTCDNDCTNHSYANIKNTDCIDNNGTPTCAYTCTDTAENCGTDTNPVCADLSTDYHHCGSCNHPCKGNQHCDGGTCHYTECASNECTVTNGSDKDCVNTDTKCGNSCTSCKSIHSNGYCDNGSCYITACKSGEHPEYNGAGKIIKCVQNTVTSCAPSNLAAGQSAQNCNSWRPSAVANAACDTNSGSCYVTNCQNGYHINWDKQSCVGNTSSSCGASNSTSTVSCSGPQNECNNGSCQCPGGKKLNYDGNNCVIPACAGIPGVYEGTLLTSSWYNPHVSDYACNPHTCNANYKRVQQGGNQPYYACLPSTNLGCSNLGYKYSAGGYCIGRQNGTGINGHNHCASDYRQYITACIHKDLCCGTRNLNMSNNLDYVCRNCIAQGKHCNTSSGNCE